MTKQMKEDAVLFQKAVGILHKYWGKEGEDRFGKMQVEIDRELQFLIGKPIHELRACISKYFTALSLDSDKINKWLDRRQKNPFGTNIHLEENELADSLLAEFALFKLAIALHNSGISHGDVTELVTATFIARRPQYRNL